LSVHTNRRIVWHEREASTSGCRSCAAHRPHRPTTTQPHYTPPKCTTNSLN